MELRGVDFGDGFGDGIGDGVGDGFVDGFVDDGGGVVLLGVEGCLSDVKRFQHRIHKE
jgi:hypothetical protein